MTELLYQTDSYLQEFDSTITAVEAETRSLILDRSAFYPGGGGQPCDFGALTVAGTVYPVQKIKKQGDLFLLFVRFLPCSGPGLQFRKPLQKLLGFFIVIPEIGCTALYFQFLYFTIFPFDVKDASINPQSFSLKNPALVSIHRT